MVNDMDLELGRFGEFLLKSRIVSERYARYHVGWVRKFLSQVPERPGPPAQRSRSESGAGWR